MTGKIGGCEPISRGGDTPPGRSILWSMVAAVIALAAGFCIPCIWRPDPGLGLAVWACPSIRLTALWVGLVCVVGVWRAWPMLERKGWACHVPWLAACMILPLIMFWWLHPVSTFLGLDKTYYSWAIFGQDYPNSVKALQLVSCSKEWGSFPLYMPDFWQGSSTAMATQAKLFHPNGLLMPHLPGFWSGYALAWNTLLLLASLAAAHMALYALLARLCPRRTLAFVFSLTATYNLRMLDCFRYLASLEAYTGLLFLTAALGFLYLAGHSRKRFICGVGVALATYWLVTSGQAQFVYMAFWGVAILLLLFPALARFAGQPEGWGSTWRYWFWSATWAAAGLALATCYWLPFYVEFIRDNATRVKSDYTFATDFQDTPWGMAANFLLPLRSDVHGAFGGSPVYLLTLVAAPLALWRLRREPAARRWIAGVMGALSLVGLYYVGSLTPFHRWCWEFVPFINTFRVSGRVSIVFPLVLSLLGWSLSVRARDWVKGNGLDTAVVFLVAAAYFCVPIAQAFCRWVPGRFPPLAIGAGAFKGPLADAIELVAYGMAVVAAAGIVALSIRPVTRVAKCAVIAASVTTLMLLLMQGTWLGNTGLSPSLSQVRDSYAEGKGYDGGVLGAGDMWGMESEVVTRHMSNARKFSPLLAQVYPTAGFVPSIDAYYAMPQPEANQLILVGESPAVSVGATTPSETSSHDSVSLSYYSLNRLSFDVVARRPSYLRLNYPYSPRWEARVHGRLASLWRANGAECAVAVPAGRSSVDFRYRSRATEVGLAVTFLTAFLLLSVSLGQVLILVGRPVVLTLFLFLCLALLLSLYARWYGSLYTGKPIPRHYEWMSPGEFTVPVQRTAIRL
ncbi:MAG TPA: hypothetical protein VHS28_11090 [Chloroflexota bacterium]|nr:hypothetical protein [Chloroflexota bacterium]